MQQDLTGKNVLRTLVRFSFPYLIASFLQTFYGLADLFITGRFNGASVITAVSIGSQLMHMLTVMIVGLAMGSTVLIGRSVGAGKPEETRKAAGCTVTLFSGLSVVLTLLLLLSSDGILRLLSTPEASFSAAGDYARICFAGVPFIIAYNVLSSMFRGMGDTKTPMYFVAAAGVINIFLDWILIGSFGMGAAGAALATVCSQGISVLLALGALRRTGTGFRLSHRDLVPDRGTLSSLLSIGVPIACQDGFIQISFLVITVIGNLRGVDAAAGIGIVEKIISFLFLVPSSMLASVAAITAQNSGAGKEAQGREALRCGITLCACYGIIVTILCNLCPERILSLFAVSSPVVVMLGAQYLRSYVTDCIFAGFHFCFNGWFSASEKSIYGFIHNVIAILLVRIPGAYAASVFFPDNLFPMGMAAPAGSLLSSLICFGFYFHMRRKAADAGSQKKEPQNG